jgi:hypothetical protein
MFHFAANLKPYNVLRGPGNRRFDSYLLSVDFFAEHRDLARLVVKENRTLCADNGNVDLIKEFINKHGDKAEPLQELRKIEEEKLEGKVRPGQLSSSLTGSFQQFAQEIFEQAEKVITDEHVVSVLRTQEAMNPTYIVGMEDFTLVTLTALDIEREYSNLPLEWYKPASERAIEYAIRTKKGEFGPCQSLVFAGLHAIDYDTAKQAGRLAGEAKLDGIASGLVGALKDKSFVDFRIENNEVIDLGVNVPRPYIRTLEIVAGFHTGYANASGQRPPFHGLGLGSPILLPLVSLIGDAQTYLAIDSTAPIKVAIARTIALYVDTPVPRKLKAHRIAEFWLSENDGWRCTCPYCRKFTELHPPNLANALEWWQGEGKRKLSSDDMHAPSPLAEFLPILSTPIDEKTKQRARMTRISHNHWVLKRIETQLRKHGRNVNSLREFVANTVQVYLKMPGSSPSWQAAAEIAWGIADKTAQELAEMSPIQPDDSREAFFAGGVP